MLEIKIGVRLATLRTGFVDGLNLAANLGIQGVEIDARHEFEPRTITQTAVRQIRKLLEDRRLRICAVTYRTRRGYDVVEDLEPRLEGTRRAMKMAFQLGAPFVINTIGTIPPNDTPQWQVLREALSDLGRYGQHVGALFAADTGHHSAEDVQRLLESLSAGALLLNLNPGELAANRHDAAEFVRQLGMHIAQVVANDGTRMAIGEGSLVQLGRGLTDWPELLSVLEEKGYRGYFTLRPETTSDPITELGDGVQFLRSF